MFCISYLFLKITFKKILTQDTHLFFRNYVHLIEGNQTENLVLSLE